MTRLCVICATAKVAKTFNFRDQMLFFHLSTRVPLYTRYSSASHVRSRDAGFFMLPYAFVPNHTPFFSQLLAKYSLPIVLNNMVYDPFGSEEDNAKKASVRRMVSVRRPPICDIRLTSLEWGVPESRMRTRTEANLPNEQSHIRSAPKPIQTTKSTDLAEKRETIRYVEKIVYKEPTTILGVPPVVDDRILHVVDFILRNVKSDKVEVEVKLGLLIAKGRGARAINFVPVKCETSINPENNHDNRFESNVGEKVFCNLYNSLNKRVELTERETKNKVHYTRTRHLDVYWPGKIRETRQIRENPDGSEYYETICVQSKTRLGDMNVMCPMNLLDMRYSASLEEDASIPPNSTPLRQRMKDRKSYKYEYLSVDITCVTMESLSAQTEGQRTFEVEVEIDPTANLFQEVSKYQQADGSSKLLDIATCLVNTVRILQKAEHI